MRCMRSSFSEVLQLSTSERSDDATAVIGSCGKLASLNAKRPLRSDAWPLASWPKMLILMKVQCTYVDEFAN